MEQLVQILSSPWNFVAFLVALIIAMVILLRTGREIRIGTKVLIPARRDSDFPVIDSLPYSFQREMAKDLKDSYRKRINNICDLRYSESLNWETEFLRQVSALYKDANTVYAVTLSSISDFWVSESDRQLIIRYLQCQEGIEVHRLFVFEGPYDLMRYKEVLDANYHAYGTTGGVYVTSSKYYKTKLLNGICADGSKYRFLNKDFGVWESEVSILATLQGKELSFERVDTGSIEQVDIHAFKRIFTTPPEGVYRWDVSSEADDFARKLFSDVTYVGPVTHLVFMRHQDKSLLEEISGKIIELDRIQKEAIANDVSINFCHDDPWWGVNLQSIGNIPPFTDGEYVGQLCCDNEFPYVLIITLPSIDDLREWYRYGEHSEIREAVYTKLVEGVADLYAKIKPRGSEKAAGFREIEKRISESGTLRRMDYIFNKKLSDIPPFQIYDQYVES